MPQTRSQGASRSKTEHLIDSHASTDKTIPANKKINSSLFTTGGKQSKSNSTVSATQTNSRISALLTSKYAKLPLSDIGLKDPELPTAETILCHLFNAILSSTRISHRIAHETLKALVDEGYQDIRVLNNTSWEQRTEVLTRGGYTHYRERTATYLGELGRHIRDNLDGDLNTMISGQSPSPTSIRSTLKNIKGLGDVGVDIFFDTVQGLWPFISPFVDPRSLKTAEKIGLGDDDKHLWDAVNQDPQEFCKLVTALTTIRLESKEEEFLKASRS